MFNLNKLIVPIAIVIISVLIGYGIGLRGAQRATVEKRLDDFAAQIDALSGVPAALAALDGKASSALASIDGLGAKLDTLTETVEGVAAATGPTGTGVSVLAEQIGGLAQGQATLDAKVTVLDKLTRELAARAPERSGGLPMAPGATETAAGSESGAQAEADRLAAEIGGDGLILGVGETGLVKGRKVFMSRLAADQAHLMVMGVGRMTAGKYTGAADLGNGCTLGYVGVAGGKAYLKPSC